MPFSRNDFLTGSKASAAAHRASSRSGNLSGKNRNEPGGEMIINPGADGRPMIEKLAERGNILAVRLTGELSDEDYTGNLIPELERALERYKKIRLLLRVEHFRG